MFKSYLEFITEGNDNLINTAEKFSKSDILKDVLIDCQEGKYQHIQVLPSTMYTKSFVGVAFNDGNAVSEVFNTEDPKVALVAIIIKNTGSKDIDRIERILTIKDSILNYAVLPGNKIMSKTEIENRFNFQYKMPEDSIQGLLTSTPIDNSNRG